MTGEYYKLMRNIDEIPGLEFWKKKRDNAKSRFTRTRYIADHYAYTEFAKVCVIIESALMIPETDNSF